ncbi:MAG: hypothetical protein D6740_10625 [Alphaproteobacteria bacterium]|nr:MAG: hypothetical protein D6740_10625 [Alphaproteobacteria bacterium]
MGMAEPKQHRFAGMPSLPAGRLTVFDHTSRTRRDPSPPFPHLFRASAEKQCDRPQARLRRPGAEEKRFLCPGRTGRAIRTIRVPGSLLPAMLLRGPAAISISRAA